MTIPGAVLAVVATCQAATAASGNYLLIQFGQPATLVEVAEVGPRHVVYREDEGAWQSLSRDRCIALLAADAVITVRRHGWLRLADGQVFPGEALSNARPTDDVLVWNQPTWLGRLKVPLGRIESVAFSGAAPIPPPGEADVLTLANGDRLEALVTALGDPVTVTLLDPDADGPSSIDLPLGRVAAVRMVTPTQRPSGQRLWLIDGSVFDVDDVLLGDDGFFRVTGLPFSEDDGLRIESEGVAAVLFRQDALLPFAALSPRRVEGPPTRYIVPAPRALDGRAALGLSPVEFRGPVSVHYLLPSNARWFSAEAHLPLLSRSWGDCRLVVRNDDRVVLSERINADQPSVTIGVAVSGSMLTIEITEGRAGSIQDRVVLNRAMVLVD